MQDLLVIIPAKFNSQRLKGKNLKKIGKCNLIEKKIISCLQAKIPRENIFLSTDSQKILIYQKKFSIFKSSLRKKKLSTSKSSTMAVILDSLRKFPNISRIEYVAILPVTNPLLSYKSIKKAYLKLKKNNKAISIVSITQPINHPFQIVEQKKEYLMFNKIKIKNKKYSDYERTQDWPESYVTSPALKISKLKFFKKYMKSFSPALNQKTFSIKKCLHLNITNKESIDINTKEDLLLASMMNEKKN